MWLRDPSALLVVLVFVPILAVILFVVNNKQKVIASQLNLELDCGLSSIAKKLVFSSMIISLLALGLSEPQVPTTRSVPVRSDTQISFVMDVSVSMAGSKEPNPCIATKGPCVVPKDAVLRIDRAKQIIKDSMGSLGVVSVAVYGFSNKTVWQMPFTYSPQLELLDNGLTAGSLQAACRSIERCTNWWTAIRAVSGEFDPEMKNKIIVLLTDGDSDVSTGSSDIQMLSELNIKVFGVSIGDNTERIWLYDDNGNSTGYFPKPLPVKDTEIRSLTQRSGGKLFREYEINGLVSAIAAAIGTEDLSTIVISEGDLSLSSLFFFMAMLLMLVFVLRYVAGVRFNFRKRSLTKKASG